MSSRRQPTAVMVAAAALTVACGSGQSRGEPSPVPLPAVAAAEIDTLIVPPDQLPGSLHLNRLPPAPPAQSGRCAYSPGATGALLAPGSLVARTVRYTGMGNVFVDQSVAVYPSAQEARSAFGSLVETVRVCQSQPLTAEPDRIAWQQSSFSQVSGVGEPYSTDARVAENVVFIADVGILPAQVATSVADAIAAKIRSAA